MKEMPSDNEGRLQEECGTFLLHFDEYGKGIPVTKNKQAEVEKDKNIYLNYNP